MIRKIGYIHNGILWRHKINKILPFASTWMEAKDSMPSETSQTQIAKYNVTPFARGVQKERECHISQKCNGSYTGY